MQENFGLIFRTLKNRATCFGGFRSIVGQECFSLWIPWVGCFQYGRFVATCGPCMNVMTFRNFTKVISKMIWNIYKDDLAFWKKEFLHRMICVEETYPLHKEDVGNLAVSFFFKGRWWRQSQTSRREHWPKTRRKPPQVHKPKETQNWPHPLIQRTLIDRWNAIQKHKYLQGLLIGFGKWLQIL